jgi:hypothetical protein
VITCKDLFLINQGWIWKEILRKKKFKLAENKRIEKPKTKMKKKSDKPGGPF